MAKISKELVKYISLQLADYVDEQTRGSYVSSKLMKKTRSGIENILIKAFGPESKIAIRKDSSKILRACLEAKQMGMASKFMKFLDSRGSERSNIISSILGEIANRNISEEYKNEKNMIKRSWKEKLKNEPSSQNLERA